VNLCLLFLQVHRETDLFFETSGVQLAQHDRGMRVVKRFTTLIKVNQFTTLKKKGGK
jgi:hypothetical protein